MAYASYCAGSCRGCWSSGVCVCFFPTHPFASALGSCQPCNETIVVGSMFKRNQKGPSETAGKRWTKDVVDVRHFGKRKLETSGDTPAQSVQLASSFEETPGCALSRWSSSSLLSSWVSESFWACSARAAWNTGNLTQSVHTSQITVSSFRISGGICQIGVGSWPSSEIIQFAGCVAAMSPGCSFITAR